MARFFLIATIMLVACMAAGATPNPSPAPAPSPSPSPAPSPAPSPLTTPGPASPSPSPANPAGPTPPSNPAGTPGTPTTPAAPVPAPFPAPFPGAPLVSPAPPQLPPQAPIGLTATTDTSIAGNTASAQSTVAGVTAATFNNNTFCAAVQAATGATGCNVTSVVDTNFAGRKFAEQVAGVVVRYQVVTASPTTFLQNLVNAANAGRITGFTVTSTQAAAVVVPPSPVAPATPPSLGTTAVIDWVIVGTTASFDTNNQAAFRSAIQQALGGAANVTVTINSVQPTTVGRKMTVQASGLRVQTTVVAPNFASAALITQRLQDTVRNNGGRIGAFTVVSLSGQTFNTAALTRPTLAVAAAAILFLAMLF